MRPGSDGGASLTEATSNSSFPLADWALAASERTAAKRMVLTRNMVRWYLASMKKGKIPAKTVDEYLAAVEEPARTTLRKIRAVVQSVAPPEATEGISYRMPGFKYKG